MTPEQAIIGRDQPDGGPLFDEDEAAIIIKRLEAAGFKIIMVTERQRRPFVIEAD